MHSTILSFKERCSPFGASPSTLPFSLLFVIGVLVFLCTLGSCSRPAAEKFVTIRALNNWYDETRMENLALAAREVNEELKEEGRAERIRLETVNLYLPWEEYREYFKNAFVGDERIDIMAIGHGHLPILAQKGYLSDLSWVRSSPAYAEVYQSLWPAMEWDGKTWGAPQDVDVTLLFANKNILQALGLPESEIRSLPERIRNGEFTRDHMRRLALRAQETGLVSTGFLHRPVNGQHFYIMGDLDGDLYYDREKSALTADPEALADSLNWFYENARELGITPENNTRMSWEEVDETVMYDRTLFWFGHTNNFYEYQVKGLSYRDLQKKFVVSLYPAESPGGRPSSVSNPTAYAVASNSEHPELIRRLLEKAAQPGYQARHAVKTYHLPIDKRSAETVEFGSNTILGDVLYMMDYTTFVPSTPLYAPFSELYYQAVGRVETGEMSPDDALSDLLTALQAELGSGFRQRPGNPQN